MATLQKIRNNAGLLVSIVIGMALLAFILGDLLKAGGSVFGTSRTEVAEIAGKSVQVQLYQQKIDENVENYKRNYGTSTIDQPTMESIQDQTWEALVRDYVMSDEYDELGVIVTPDELFDMVQGNNIHPQILQIPIFKNEVTGQFDRNMVIQFLKNMELDPSGNALASWTAFEKSLSEEQTNTKYNTLVQKGLFITSLQAKLEAANKGVKVDFEYMVAPYSSVTDSAISYNESELQSYYKANESKYQQDKSAEINYVTFPVIASANDDTQTRELIEELIPEFESVENVEQFVNLNSDHKFDPKYFSADELPGAISELYNKSEGTVFGPYKEDNAYKVARVVKFENIPDSVKARPILIRPDQMGVEAAIALGDSLLKVVKAGGNFAELAKEYSADGSAQLGGDLGWFTEGKMVKPFSDACFFGKKGDLVAVNSQFGVHVIEVLDQAKATKKVQVAVVARTIEPSSKTFQDTYAKASKFGGENRTYSAFIEAAKTEGLNARYAKFGVNDRRVANLDNPRQLIRWAFKTEAGQVSDIFEFDNVFVVAAVKKLNEEGTSPFADVRVDVEREVKKQKKAVYLAAKIEEAKAGAATLQAVASKLDFEVKEANNATFGAFQVPGLGVEPAVQGIMASLDLDVISDPIEGNRGVYVVKVLNINEGAPGNIDAQKMALTRSLTSRVRYEAFNALKEASNIEDRRSEFY